MDLKGLMQVVIHLLSNIVKKSLLSQKIVFV